MEHVTVCRRHSEKAVVQEQRPASVAAALRSSMRNDAAGPTTGATPRIGIENSNNCAGHTKQVEPCRHYDVPRHLSKAQRDRQADPAEHHEHGAMPDPEGP